METWECFWYNDKYYGTNGVMNVTLIETERLIIRPINIEDKYLYDGFEKDAIGSIVVVEE